MSNAFDQVLIKLQYWLPTQLISHFVGALGRCRTAAIKNALIRSFVWLYNIDTAEAQHPVPSGYPDFNAFFTRELKPGNERLIGHFDGPLGPFSIVMVGAMNVGSISTAWAGQVMPHAPRETFRRSYPGSEAPVRLNKGEYLGHFCLGSTVILISGPDQLAWHEEVRPGSSVRMGQRIGQLTADSAT